MTDPRTDPRLTGHHKKCTQCGSTGTHHLSSCSYGPRVEALEENPLDPFSLVRFRILVWRYIENRPTTDFTDKELSNYGPLAEKTAKTLQGIFAHTANALTKAVWDAGHLEPGSSAEAAGTSPEHS